MMFTGFSNMTESTLPIKRIHGFTIFRISQDETCHFAVKTWSFERQYTASCKVLFNGQCNTALFLHNNFRRCTVSLRYRLWS